MDERERQLTSVASGWCQGHRLDYLKCDSPKVSQTGKLLVNSIVLTMEWYAN